jgi:hypothetical protein
MLVKCELLIVYNVNGLMFIWLIKGFVYILVFDENEVHSQNVTSSPLERG